MYRERFVDWEGRVNARSMAVFQVKCFREIFSLTPNDTR